MKKKIKLIDNINKKEITKEVEIRAFDHLEAQKKYRATMIEDKRRKKPKYKKKYEDQDE